MRLFTVDDLPPELREAWIRGKPKTMDREEEKRRKTEEERKRKEAERTKKEIEEIRAQQAKEYAKNLVDMGILKPAEVDVRVARVLHCYCS